MEEELRKKYENNEYMLQKLNDYLKHLPLLMETFEKEYLQKCERKKQLCQQKEEFIESFMNTHALFYISSTEQYIEKKQNEFAFIKEDDVLYRIGSCIPSTLVHIKYKMIPIILKRLRERSFFNTVTDTYIVKKIIHSMPFNKETSIYFLTILGDTFLNKKDSLIYYIDASYKTYITQLSRKIYLAINKSILDIFKHKYYDHKYEQCRIIPGTCAYTEISSILDIIHTSIGLSTKYGSADLYLKQVTPEFYSKVMILPQHTPESLIQHFINSHMIYQEGLSTTYKDVYFLWKMFLHKHHLPFVIPKQHFELFLTQFKLLDNGVIHLTPNVPITLLKLKHFWETYMVHDDDIYYELQEIVDIYNKHDKTSISTIMLKEFIELEHPSILIDNHKIFNIRCTLWDKISDIEITLELFKNQKEMNDPYDFYCQYTTLANSRQVTRDYFIEYMNVNDL
jgi:hypothetical protein